jgi:hypothetical protein
MNFILTHDFMRGAIAMGLLVGAVFFFRFWRETRDRLFIFFSAALLLMAFNRSMDSEQNLWPYLVRLLAYVIILIAIADKNLRRT